MMHSLCFVRLIYHVLYILCYLNDDEYAHKMSTNDMFMCLILPK